MPSLRVLVVAACGAAAIAGCVATLQANEVVDFWREERTRQSPSTTAPAPARHTTAAPATTRGQAVAKPTARTKVTVWPKQDVSKGRASAKLERDDDDSSGRGGGEVYCVRTCDGYFFPANSNGSSAENKKFCRSLCPGAATEPYRMGKNDDIENATSTKGKAYTALPTAFAYRKGMKESCTCGSPTRTGFAALRTDPTLAPDDIVVTERGIRVFVGGKFPYRESDFVPYRKARGLGREVTAYLDRLERPYAGRRSGEAGVTRKGRRATKPPQRNVRNAGEIAAQGQELASRTDAPALR